MSTQPLLSGLVHSLSAHGHLAPDDIEAIYALPTTRRVVTPSTYLMREGDRSSGCAVLIDGFAYRQKLTGDGARQIVSIHIPGDSLDFQNVFLHCADHNIQALTHATVATIPRQAIIELFQTRPAVANAILVDALIESSISREWVLNVGRRDAHARIAHVLCEFATRMDDRGLAKVNGGYEFAMTQEQLGDATGLTGVHVNRMLRQLESEGLIERRGRTINFPSIERLRDAGDFSALYLHRHDEGTLAMA